MHWVGNRWTRTIAYVLIGEAAVLLVAGMLPALRSASSAATSCSWREPAGPLTVPDESPDEESIPVLPTDFHKVPGTEGALPDFPILWRSRNQVIVHRDSSDGSTIPVLVDTARSGEASLDWMFAPFGKSAEMSGWNDAASAQISPDGDWVLWANRVGSDIVWRAVSFQGGSASWMAARGADGTATWLPDGSAWVEWVAGNSQPRMVYHSVRDIRGVRSVDVPRGVFSDNSTVMASDGTCVAAGVVDESNQVPIYRFAPGSTVASVDLVQGPPQGWVADFALSPGGDRILWKAVTAWPRVGRCGTSTWSESAPFTVSLWTSRTDGTEMRRLLPDQTQGAFSPTSLHWTPDGRAAFWYDDAVWVGSAS